MDELNCNKTNTKLSDPSYKTRLLYAIFFCHDLGITTKAEFIDAASLISNFRGITWEDIIYYSSIEKKPEKECKIIEIKPYLR